MQILSLCIGNSDCEKGLSAGWYSNFQSKSITYNLPLNTKTLTSLFKRSGSSVRPREKKFATPGCSRIYFSTNHVCFLPFLFLPSPPGLLLKSHRNTAWLCRGLEQLGLRVQRTGRDMAGNSPLWKSRRFGPQLPGCVYQSWERLERSKNFRSVSFTSTLLCSFWIEFICLLCTCYNMHLCNVDFTPSYILQFYNSNLSTVQHRSVCSKRKTVDPKIPFYRSFLVKTDILTDHWHRKICVGLDLQFPLASSARRAFKRVKLYKHW